MSPDPPNQGSQIGPYRVVRKLGHGAQGCVYLAEDSRLPKRVALKTLAVRHGADATVVEELISGFRAEAEVLCRLDHPGICDVYEAGVDQGQAYIAMRYVPGDTLSKEIGAGLPRTWPEIRRRLGIVEQVARALHAAHESSVIHRDLKPSNILLRPEGVPVIVDFGLAQLMADAGAFPAGSPFEGTPAYTSPENIMSRVMDLDARSDVFSLGIVLHECVTGKRPFEGSRQDVYRAIAVKDAPDPARENPSLPRELAAVLGKALAKDRDRRYQSARDLAEDLARIQRLEIPPWMRASPGLVALRGIQRNPVAAAATGFAGLLLALVLALTMLITSRSEKQSRDRVQHARDLVSSNPGLALAYASEAAKRDRGIPGLSDLLARIAVELKSKVMLVGEGGKAVDAAFDPEGSRVLTACKDGSVRIWDARTGGALHEISYPSGEVVEAVGWREGDPVLLTRAADGRSLTVRTSRDPVAVPLRNGRVTKGWLSPGGDWIAARSDVELVSVWAHGAPTPVIDAVPGVDRVSFVRDEPRVVLSLSDHRVVVRDLADPAAPEEAFPGQMAAQRSRGSHFVGGVECRTLPTSAPGNFAPPPIRDFDVWCVKGKTRRRLGSHAQVNDIDCSPVEELLVTASEDRTVKLWDNRCESEDAVSTLTMDSAVVIAKFSPTGDRILAGSSGGSFAVWSLAALDRAPLHLGIPVSFDPSRNREVAVPLRTGESRDSWSHGLVSRDGAFVITTRTDHTQILEVSFRRSRRLDATVAVAEFSHDGAFCATQSQSGGTVTVWKYEPLEPIARNLKSIPSTGPDGRHARIEARFSPKRHELLTFGRQHGAVLWDFDAGATSRRVAGAEDEVANAGFVPSGSGVVIVSRGAAKIVPTGAGNPVSLQAPVSAAADFPFTEDGGHVALVDDAAVSICDCATGAVASRLDTSGDPAHFIQFSLTGRRVVTAGQNGTSCAVWDWSGANGRRISVFSCAGDSLVHLSDDGRLLVVASRESIKIWDVAKRATVWEPRGQTNKLGISPDRRWIIAQSSTCADEFVWLPIDPFRETQDLAFPTIGHRPAELRVR